jgi:hypothetical protein
LGRLILRLINSMKINQCLWGLVLLAISSLACQKRKSPELTRPFYMGVTPWPADFTLAEVNNSYAFINGQCDIVSQHFDDGIPWQEVYLNQPWPAEFQQEIQTRKAKTASFKKILLSVSALNLTRKEKPDYYKQTVYPDSIKNHWKQLPFNDPKVVTAYINYISVLINAFQPLYVNFGVESNLSLWAPADFALYKDFIAQVYPQLKSRFPNTPFFVSFMVDEMPQSLPYAAQLIPYTDYVTLSAYPYVNASSTANGNTNPALFPADLFTRYSNLAPQKPFAIAETGYIAENLVIPAFSLNKQGNETWQRDYLEMMCKLCDEKKAQFLIWFCHKDYDAGSATLHTMGLYQDLFGIWEDTGFKDENGRERPAYQSWVQWMQRRKTD